MKSVKSFEELSLARETKISSAEILTRYPENKIYYQYYEDKLILVLFFRNITVYIFLTRNIASMSYFLI
jgi:hypothetical protein